MAGDLRWSFENQSEPRTSKMYKAIFFASMVLTGCASQDSLRYSPTLDKALRTSTEKSAPPTGQANWPANRLNIF